MRRITAVRDNDTQCEIHATNADDDHRIFDIAVCRRYEEIDEFTEPTGVFINVERVILNMNAVRRIIADLSAALKIAEELNEQIVSER